MRGSVRTSSSTPSLEISIERLLLHGRAPEEGPLVVAAAERALGELIARDGLPPHLQQGGAHAVPGSTLRVSGGASVDEVGAHLARALYSAGGGGGDGGSGDGGTP